MMKIATITFHWATNYGAVLQAFALQKYLEKSGYEAEIIDYVPSRVKLLSYVTWIRRKKFGEFRKEKLIGKFRHAELKLSEKKYRSCKKLKSTSFDYDCIISGSDQLWNKNFTLNLDGGKPNLSYFLDFADEKTVKLAYAVSFGATHMPDEYYDRVKPFANAFQAISVREQTAIPIVEQMGRKAEIVCDPTLLLDRADYEKLIEKKRYQCGKVFCYILHENQYTAQKIAQEVKKIYRENEDRTARDDMYAWLYKIKNSEIVVTNSFHGTMLALIFNTPFIVVPVEGFDMNDRIKTILDVVHLENRIVSDTDADVLRSLCSEKIDWDQVNRSMAQYSRTGKDFLSSNLAMYAEKDKQ